MSEEICEYRYTPKADRTRAALSAGVLLLLSAALFSLTLRGGRLSEYFMTAATLPFFIAMLTARRFITAEYTYFIMRDAYTGERTLLIKERHAGRCRKLCHISVLDIEEIAGYEGRKVKGRRRQRRPKPDKKKYGAIPVYNYCPEINPSRYCLIRIGGREEAYIKLMPDERMRELLEKTD